MTHDPVITEAMVVAGLNAAMDEGWSDLLPNDVRVIYLAMHRANPVDVEGMVGVNAYGVGLLLEQWQNDQKEFFNANVLSVVAEYAIWRERRAAIEALNSQGGL